MNDLLQLKKPLARKEVDLDNNIRKVISSHKRPLISQEISSKRVKSIDTTITKATPQLLQQLITTTGVKTHPRQYQKNQVQSLRNEPIQYSQMQLKQQQQQKQQSQRQQEPVSNSVLMNLLVSGCDVSAGYYTCLPPSKVAKA